MTSESRSQKRRRLEGLCAPEAQQGDRCLDAVGLYCPVPIIKTDEAIRLMKGGEVLEVRADDRVILIDMPAWCLSTGHEYLGFREEQEEWRLFVRKK